MIFASARLSSISRICSSAVVVLIRDNLCVLRRFLGLHRRSGADARRGRGAMETDEERGSPAGLAFHPEPAAVRLDDLAADRQARTRALELLPGVQPPEELEDRRVELGIDADPVVLDGDRGVFAGIGTEAGVRRAGPAVRDRRRSRPRGSGSRCILVRW